MKKFLKLIITLLGIIALTIVITEQLIGVLKYVLIILGFILVLVGAFVFNKDKLVFNNSLIIKIALIAIGFTSYIICYIENPQDIGRFPLILFGFIFSLIGSYKEIKNEK